MALIKCPECGREISDKSKQCIHCGYPIEQTNKNTTYAIYLKNITKGKYSIIIMALFLMIIVIIVFVLRLRSKNHLYYI